MGSSSKPTYYLWKAEDVSMEELEKQKRIWMSYGFRVVIFIDGDTKKDINHGLKEVIKNHLK